MTRALYGDREERRVMEVLINAANILYLLSYFVRDILKLRVLTVVAASCLIAYFYFQPEPDDDGRVLEHVVRRAEHLLDRASCHEAPHLISRLDPVLCRNSAEHLEP